MAITAAMTKDLSIRVLRTADSPSLLTVGASALQPASSDAVALTAH
jgi:hypothetical protein